MATIEQLEARLTELEQRLPPAPTLQANPPITVGELADVPAPGTPVASAWTEDADSDNFAGPAATTITIPAGLDGIYAIQFRVTMAAPTANGLVRLLTTGAAGASFDSPITTDGQIGAVTAIV